MSEFREIPEHGEAEPGKTYRSTYHIGGPYPAAWVTNSLAAAVRGLAGTGRIKVLSTETFFKGQLPGGPAGTWAFRVTWQKQGSGTPLAFFMGPAGIITLAIVGVIVVVTGALILARTLEELSESVPGFTNWLPAALLGGVLILGLAFRGRRT